MNTTHRNIRDLIAAFLVSSLVVGFLLFSSPGMVGIDGYYHISIASMIWHEGLTFSFPYLEFTLLDQAHYVDMHMLFHLLQSPFTAILDLEVAAKLSATVFIATTFTLFVWLLRQYDVPYPLFWAMLLLILSESFLYRMMMPRPPIFALAYTWLAFHCLMQKKYLGLAIVACLFAWTYKVFPILLPMAVIGMVVIYVEQKKVDIRPLIAVLVGIVAGLLINPYFPDNVSFLWNAIQMKILSDSFQASVGNEWYPLKTLTLLKDAAIPLAAYLLGILLTNRDEWKNDPARLFWFLLSSMWLLMLFKSRRFIEFFPPAALLFFIFAIRPWLQQQSLGQWLKQRTMCLPALSIAVLLLAGGYHTLSEEYDRLQDRQPVEAYQGGANWLAQHTPAGSRVFHTDWDDFPRLFFHNRHNIYIVGLDPDYMRLKDAELYETWRRIGKGKDKQPEDTILNIFDAEYVITDRRHKSFIRVAEKSGRMQRVYGDKYTRVYRVLEPESAD
ncbi:MAG: hypothetical protein ACE5E3_00850 [Mariprofundus sp.]